MSEKFVFDYKEPFNAPYMIREITKKIKLPFSMQAQDVLVFTMTLVIVGGGLFLFFGFTKFVLLATLLCAYGLVKLVNSFEPDGKKIHFFIIDYVVFLVLYQLGRKSFYHGQRIYVNEDVVSYDIKLSNDIEVKE